MHVNASLIVAVAAGSLATVALAQPSGQPARPRATLAHVTGPMHPLEVRKVGLVNNQVVALGAWEPYRIPSSDAGTPTICWDAYHNEGGHAPNTAPGGGRWLFSWTSTGTTPNYDYNIAGMAIPVNNILPGAAAIGAKYFDFLAIEKLGGDQYVAIYASESYFDTAAPDASWGVFPGWQFHYVNVPVNSFFYYPTVLTDPNIWQLPADGNGGVIVKASRDEAGLIPAVGYQFAQWGTQEHTTPAPSPAKVGTSGPNQWDDESTGTVCRSNAETNIPDGAFLLQCENFSWDYGAAYQPEPFTFCVALGFDQPQGNTCYANCDQSSVDPILNANDFQCFLNAYAAAQSLPPEEQTAHYANCDLSSVAPVLNANDFQCFLNAYAAGCS